MCKSLKCRRKNKGEFLWTHFTYTKIKYDYNLRPEGLFFFYIFHISSIIMNKDREGVFYGYK